MSDGPDSPSGLPTDASNRNLWHGTAESGRPANRGVPPQIRSGPEGEGGGRPANRNCAADSGFPTEAPNRNVARRTAEKVDAPPIRGGVPQIRGGRPGNRNYAADSGLPTDASNRKFAICGTAEAGRPVPRAPYPVNRGLPQTRGEVRWTPRDSDCAATAPIALRGPPSNCTPWPRALRPPRPGHRIASPSPAPRVAIGGGFMFAVA